MLLVLLMSEGGWSVTVMVLFGCRGLCQRDVCMDRPTAAVCLRALAVSSYVQPLATHFMMLTFSERVRLVICGAGCPQVLVVLAPSSEILSGMWARVSLRDDASHI